MGACSALLQQTTKPMDSSVINPRAVVSTNGDVLIVPGSAGPILFIPRTHVGDLLEGRPRAAAVLIDNIGAAAVATFLAAGAMFDAAATHAGSGEIESVTIRFTLPNGLVCVWTTDDALADDRARLKSLGIQLAVTNSSVNWERKHAGLIGEVISAVAPVPPQFASLQQFNPEQLTKLVRRANSETNETEQ